VTLRKLIKAKAMKCADKQSSKLIDPSKGAFRCKATFIETLIEYAFGSWFSLLAITFVLRNVWQELVIKTNLASFFGIKGL